MRILLLGEYSNVHCTLALGLRALGHSVTVLSDGDGWKNYPRDIDVARRDFSPLGSAAYWWSLRRTVRSLRGYDVVQLINPVFLPLKAERIWPLYAGLRRRNGKMFLGAYGMDYYYACAGKDCHTFRYSDFNIGPQLRTSADISAWEREWIHGEKGRLNRYIAADCDGIIAGLYEYHAAYFPHFPDKLTFLPFPILLDQSKPFRPRTVRDGRLRLFLGEQRGRTQYKGTDIMRRALERAVSRYPERSEMVHVESVPFARYCELMEGSQVLLDQLYSYTPGMNALEAMARGLVVVGGGEPENYAILEETQLRPIVNVQPTEEDVYEKLCDLITHPEAIPRLSADSRRYIERHHDYITVARRYLDFWSSK